jgi:hypothetical protein
MRCHVNAFVTQTMIQETWLPMRCLATDGRSDSDIIRLLGGTPHYFRAYDKMRQDISTACLVEFIAIFYILPH